MGVQDLKHSRSEVFLVYLSRFMVTAAFGAWQPGDRDYPERQVSILPGPKDLFTDEAEKDGAFVKFLKNGTWFEASRADFDGATQLRKQDCIATAQ